jgi:Protein of unknown function (DUF3574)
MRRFLRCAVFWVVSGGCLTLYAQEPARGTCGASAKVLTRTTMYFGLNRPAGTISEKEWQGFLRDKVTPRFPDGLTVWEANGQWRAASGKISREKAKVLLLVHDGSAGVREAIQAIIAEYKQGFQQESVLWETASVCAAF